MSSKNLVLFNRSNQKADVTTLLSKDYFLKFGLSVLLTFTSINYLQLNSLLSLRFTTAFFTFTSYNRTFIFIIINLKNIKVVNGL